MPNMRHRVSTQIKPYRTEKRISGKIIFLSLEGSATEEEYFKRVSEIYSGIQNKIRFISVAEDAVRTKPKKRTQEQQSMLSKVRPKQLVERIEQFKEEKETQYQFSLYPEDEFWIVTDVDNNWSDDYINPKEEKRYREEWQEAKEMCESKGYGYAISNPFFEVWLLLHHDDPRDEDKVFAVTEAHPYQKTSHFRDRLCELGAALKGKKHIQPLHYDESKIEKAIERAKVLHIDKDPYPLYFATTVYLLLEKIIHIWSASDEMK